MLAGILVILLPFYKITIWTLVGQVLIAIYLFSVSIQMLGTWDEKKRKIELLISRNSKKLRHDTFSVYVQAPCGRLITKYVLMELHKSHEYKTVLKLKKPFIQNIKANCTPVDTVIYINKDAI
jgi:hypothetical protein